MGHAGERAQFAVLVAQHQAMAAHLHVLLRRKTGRVTDTEWMVANQDYAREVVRFARMKAREDGHQDLEEWAVKLEQAVLGKLSASAATIPAPPSAALVAQLNGHLDGEIAAREASQGQRLGELTLAQQAVSAGGEQSLAREVARRIADYLGVADNRPLTRVRYESFWMVRHFPGTFSPVPGTVSYSWLLPAGWIGSSTTNTIGALSGSSGTISVSASNACGKSDPQKLSVTIQICSGVNEFVNEELQVNVFPNPNNGQFELNINGAAITGQVKIKMYDLVGALVFETEFMNGDVTKKINASHLSKGVYFVRLKRHDGHYTTLKFVKY